MSEVNIKKSMVDVAYDIMLKQKKIFKFNDLYNLVATELEFDDEMKANRISKFYTNLSLDGRFVNLSDYTWDLRANQTFDKAHIEMKEYYSAIDEEHGIQVNEEGEEVKIDEHDDTGDDDILQVDEEELEEYESEILD